MDRTPVTANLIVEGLRNKLIPENKWDLTAERIYIELSTRIGGLINPTKIYLTKMGQSTTERLIFILKNNGNKWKLYNFYQFHFDIRLPLLRNFTLMFEKKIKEKILQSSHKNNNNWNFMISFI